MLIRAGNKLRPSAGRVCFLFLLGITVFAIYGVDSAYGKEKARHGTIKILSSPGGMPLEIDGKSLGTTTTEFRSIDLDPGVHRIVVTLPSGQLWTREVDLAAGRIKCVTLSYRASMVSPSKSPCPFPVNITGPSQVSEGEIITYTAGAVYGGSSPLTYTWTITPSNARILSGAGTPTITVDSTGLAGQRLEAVLVVDDGSGDAACRQTTRMSTFVPPTPPRENPARQFDVCCGCSRDDQKARLDNLTIELQHDPSTTAYIVTHAGRNSAAGEADRLGTRAVDYIVSQRGISRSRIVVMNGGFREEDCVELWIVPSGAQPPTPTPTVSPGAVRPRSTRPSRP